MIAVSAFLAVINSGVSDACPFCPHKETVFHCFSECVHLAPLFILLKKLFQKMGEIFSTQQFICGVKYRRSAEHKYQLANFIVGQAKMAVYVSRNRKIDHLVDINLTLLFKRMVKARIMIDFNYYKEMKDVDEFNLMWAHGDVLCSVKESQLLFSEELLSFLTVYLFIVLSVCLKMTIFICK